MFSGTKAARVLELEKELQALKGQKNVVEAACNRVSNVYRVRCCFQWQYVDFT